MKNRELFYAKIAFIASFLLFLGFSISYSRIQTNFILDSTEVYKVILQIGHLNDDSVQDTIIGTARSDMKFLPRLIVWGIDTTNNGIPESLKYYQSEISYQYVDWDKFHGRVNLLNMNQDTLLDIVLVLSGQICDTLENCIDTVVSIVLFGQRGLDTVSLFNIAEIDTYQIQPYVAMNMRMEHEFTEAKIRDISGVVSYEVNNIDIDVNKPSGDPPPIIPTDVTDIKPEVRIYPNPAIYYTNLELNQTPPGTYIVQIITLAGKLEQEQKIDIKVYGGLIRQIDLSKVPSGLYILKLADVAGKFKGTYQIIVIH